MFSATYTEQVFEFAQKLIADPVIIRSVNKRSC